MQEISKGKYTRENWPILWQFCENLIYLSAISFIDLFILFIIQVCDKPICNAEDSLENAT